VVLWPFLSYGFFHEIYSFIHSLLTLAASSDKRLCVGLVSALLSVCPVDRQLRRSLLATCRYSPATEKQRTASCIAIRGTRIDKDLFVGLNASFKFRCASVYKIAQLFLRRTGHRYRTQTRSCIGLIANV